MPLTDVTVESGEPIALAMAKRQCSVPAEDFAHDVFFQTQAIPAARERAETATRRQLRRATCDLVLDRFPHCSVIELPRPPLLAVTWIRYVDIAGATQTWSASEYLVQTPAGPRCRRGRITPGHGYTWPATRAQMGAVTIRFTCGWGGTPGGSPTPVAVPPLLVQGMLMDLATLFEHRESVSEVSLTEVPRGAQSIYRAFCSRPLVPLEGVDG